MVDHESVPELITELHLSGVWGGAILLLVGLAGGLFVVNVFFPSGLVLVASGALIGAGAMSWTVAIWAGAGVVLGCSASYALGRAIGPRFHKSRCAANRRELLASAEGLLARFGAIALFFAYFSGPLRGAAPFAAGLIPLPFVRFQAINIASATAWIAATMTPGALLWPVAA